MDAPRARSRGSNAATPWIVIAALALTLVVNGLASYLPLAGRTTGEISARFPVLITPAGFAFSIWGVIYVALTAFAVYQALPAGRREPGLEPLRRLFVATCVFNAGWLVAWHYLYTGVALALMYALLGTLVAMYARAGGDRAPSGSAWTWCVRVPVSLYLGWITVASVVNTRVVAYDLGWTGGGATDRLVTVLAVTVVALLALTLLARRRDLAYAAVIVWASFGIWAANRGVPSVAFAAAAAGLLVITGVIWTVVSWPRRPDSAR